MNLGHTNPFCVHRAHFIGFGKLNQMTFLAVERRVYTQRIIILSLRFQNDNYLKGLNQAKIISLIESL